MGDINAEVESIRAVAKGMTTGAINTATQLQSVLAELNNYAAAGDWSQVPSCKAFGESYNSAIIAYKAVADDMLSDAKTMQQRLLDTAAAYDATDANSKADFEAKLAALGTGYYMTHQDAADKTYHQHRGDLHSDNPEAAPHQDADTGTSGSTTTPSTPAPTSTGRGRVAMG